jgi:CDP-6-deoxy-D-xylo-4-hexulose-3-dehydrase
MISLASDSITKKDIKDLINWLSQDKIPKLTKGDLTYQLEEKWAKKIKTKYSVFVNSGSSAIFLTLAALKESKRLKNLKIIIPSLSWATDVSSPMILGYDVTLCDCNLTDLSCDLNHLESLFKKHDPAVFILVSVLGLVPDMIKIKGLCEKYDVILLEDVCESMGSKYQDKYLGSFGSASFFSTYFGHHISTIEGGFINTNEEWLYHLLLMMRSHGWDRDLPQEKRTELRQKYECTEFDALYNFYVPGFNLRSTDLQAFIGIQAIDKLDNYSDIRNRNFKLYKELLINNELKLFIGEEDYISSLAMPFVNKEKYKIIELLKENNVEIRPLIAGNMAKKPMWKNGTEGIINCEIIDQHGFYLPNHQDLTQDEVRFICSICTQAIPSTNS